MAGTIGTPVTTTMPATQPTRDPVLAPPASGHQKDRLEQDGVHSFATTEGFKGSG
ncbi:hypothetical protein [Nonomuraea roseola]|uniref:Uncharacterized protein n=1 Tax=Nonomuraea roseola TaxID=46179 RepID=A0ABV5Q428_9ACTN